MDFRKCRLLLFIIFSLIAGRVLFAGPKVVIVVIDGARYADTFGAEAAYIPHLWNDLRSNGTYYTKFYNNRITSTVPGHASLVTGTWQEIANDGSELPHRPTIFEYYRETSGADSTKVFNVTGKAKLQAICYSDYSGYGSDYRAAHDCRNRDDESTYQTTVDIMDANYPDLLLINFRDVDSCGHNYGLDSYRQAIRIADSLVYLLWQKIQGDDYYRDMTTLFVTADHGMHEVEAGSYMTHGDTVTYDRHIPLFAIGRNVAQGKVISETREQIDLAPTIGDLLSFETTFATGTSLYEGDQSLPVEIINFYGEVENGAIGLRWQTASECENLGFGIERRILGERNWQEIASFRYCPALEGQGNSSVTSSYRYRDREVIPGQVYQYHLFDVDYGGFRRDHRALIVQQIVPLNKAENYLQVYPNPFNSIVQIRIRRGANDSLSEISIFDLTGKSVHTFHTVPIHSKSRYDYYSWDASRLKSGLYIIRLRTGSASHFQKCVLVK